MKPASHTVAPRESWLLRMALRQGSLSMVVLSKVVSVVLSCAIAALVMWMTGKNSGTLFLLFMAALIPALVAPVASSTIVHMLFELNGNPPENPKAPEVEFSMKEVLHEEVKIYGQPDHGCAQAG